LAIRCCFFMSGPRAEFLVQIITHSQGLKDYYSPDEKKPGWMVRAFSVCVEVC